ncbi:hypothetical protein [Arthrobacter sp.]|uniref:hypothetical protein n=1 Tax=Arthrobacter sp. TaxID=1667 RepID=UPI002896317D|nr:hypothetical protein [Arthrobacter sp.]
MSSMREHVDLPDEDRQRLVHPLDQADARRPFLYSLWLREAASPQLFFLLAAVLWSVSNNFVTPIVGPLSVAVIAGLGARKTERDAWSYIPRRRQDLARTLPTAWIVSTAAFRAAALFAGLLIICVRFSGSGLPAGVAAWSVGAGAAVVLLMAMELLWHLRASRLSGEPARDFWPQAFSLAAVLGALLFATAVLRADGAPWRPADLLAGAAVMVGVQLLWWLSQGLPHRQEERP